jgi:RimJ/RimL family protein N-acetyltransferase
MVGAVGPDPGPLTTADVDRWYSALEGEPYSWVVEFEARCIGVARLHDVHRTAGTARYAIGLFRPEHRGLGLGQEITRLVLDHAFGPLDLSRVELRVLDFNQRALACYRRCGFREIAREPVQLGGIVASDVIMEVERPRRERPTDDRMKP